MFLNFLIILINFRLESKLEVGNSGRRKFLISDVFYFLGFRPYISQEAVLLSFCIASSISVGVIGPIKKYLEFMSVLIIFLVIGSLCMFVFP